LNSKDNSQVLVVLALLVLICAIALAAGCRPLLGWIASEAAFLAHTATGRGVKVLEASAGCFWTLACTCGIIFDVFGVDFGAVNGWIAHTPAEAFIEDHVGLADESLA
jgi:hypothetical protein